MKFKYNFMVTLATLVTVFSAIYSLPAVSDFVIKEKVDKDPCFKFPHRENYGNGQTCGFRRAIGGYNLCGEDPGLACVLPINEVGRFYGRLSAGSASYTLDTFKNRSISPLDLMGNIVTTSATKSSPIVEIAVGYVWSPTFRVEVEYLATRNFGYIASPVLSGPVPARSFTSTIQMHPFLLNFYYDFKWFERFRPYVIAGVGFSVNSINSAVTPVPPLAMPPSGQRTRQMGSFVYTAGGGLEFAYLITGSLMQTFVI